MSISLELLHRPMAWVATIGRPGIENEGQRPIIKKSSCRSVGDDGVVKLKFFGRRKIANLEQIMMQAFS
jgi:hypothetical protein